MVALIKSKMLQYPVVWGHPDASREALARILQAGGENKIGVPGATVFRTGARRAETFNNPLAQWGWPNGRTADGDYINTQTIGVKSDYAVVCWAREISDLNEMERALWFLDSYGTVAFNVKTVDAEDNPVSYPIEMPVMGDDSVIYDCDRGSVDKKPLWYSVRRNFVVDAFWCLSNIDPQILEIDVTYKLITSGDPVDDETVDFIEIGNAP